MNYIRWQIARALVALAMKVAPPGPARDLLFVYLTAYSADIMAAIVANRAQENGDGE